LDTPKFQIPGRPRGRQPGEAAKSVKEMSWANQKPESFMDFVRGRFLTLLLMVGVLAGGFSVLNSRAKNPENQKKAPKAAPSPEDELRGGTFVVPSDTAATDAAPQSPRAEEHAADDNPEDTTKKDRVDKDNAKDDSAPADFEGERKLYPGREAMVHTFKEPLPEFKPLEELDYKDDSFHELYALVMDDDLRTVSGRRNAANYAYAAEIMYLYFRFLRTHADNPEKIEEYYRNRKTELTDLTGSALQAEANHLNVMENPMPYRGQLYKFHGRLMQKHQIRVWANDEENNSGVQETWLLICRDLKYRDRLYGVLVPHSARHLRSREEIDNADLVSWKGLFLQRWPYEQKNDRYGQMPLYVAWTVARLDRPPSKHGTNWVLVAVGALLCVGLIFVFWQTSKDDKRAGKFRRNLRRKEGADKKGSEQESKPAESTPPATASAAPEPEPPQD